MNATNSSGDSPFDDHHSGFRNQNETDWIDFLFAYFEALQRFIRIPLVNIQSDRQHKIRTRSTLFLPAAGISLAILLTVLLIIVQFFWPLYIAILMIGSLELLCLRTFTPEAIPQSRELLIPSSSAGSSSNIFVLTITLMLLRMGLLYHLLADSVTFLEPCILIVISISLGIWFIPFSICFVEANDDSARWANPKYPLTTKQLSYASTILIPLLLAGTWFSPVRFLLGLFAAALLIYWIIRKLEDYHIEISDVHIEGLSSLFQIIFLLICSIDFSFLKKLSE
ncbi:hypothetical protein [Gimesia algae]|uniref:Adenosylcobinamide-GDP ribazoletransferase n=1 Tax=Gimesia algae TaxID=2527971 RepID=A0A517VN05_9PLAN|nr:hypothetical protein [Gimesia algae]QDT94386.1 hypothetical protein Pan161_60820 [Gimesia algae]